MRMTKEFHLSGLQRLMNLLPRESVERLYKFFTDPKVSGDIYFHFHQSKVIGWGSTIGKSEDWPFKREKK